MKCSTLKVTAIIGLGITLAFSSCSDDDEIIPNGTGDVDVYSSQKEEIKSNYANIVYSSYEDSYNEAKELQNAIIDFIANPSQTAFDACRTKWLDAREPYGQTEVYRFANGPIDDANGPEGALNAWPLDENYVDYISTDSTAGIINDTSNFPSITETVLENANELGSEKNISLGYHAIEFLLWGQDSPNTGLKTPGNRPYTDYLVQGGTAANQARRAEYLKVAAKVLVTDLKKLVDAWDSNNNNNYRTSFMGSANNQALQGVFTGMGTLSKSELAGERIFVALNNQNQEDEHSCFSDNTHRDIILNAQGIRNVYTGEYKRVDGTIVSGKSIQDLITIINLELALSMDSLSLSSMVHANAIPIPFDNALTQENVGGNGPIMTTVRTLQAQGDKIAEVATAIGISISTELPD